MEICAVTQSFSDDVSFEIRMDINCFKYLGKAVVYNGNVHFFYRLVLNLFKEMQKGHINILK